VQRLDGEINGSEKWRGTLKRGRRDMEEDAFILIILLFLFFYIIYLLFINFICYFSPIPPTIIKSN
jgi:hypothetical protein